MVKAHQPFWSRWPEEGFKRWLAVLIASATLLAGVATYLQTQAANQSALWTRRSQQAAVHATASAVLGEENFAYQYYQVVRLRDELYDEGVSRGLLNAAPPPRARAFLTATQTITSLSPLLGPAYSQFEPSGFRKETDLGRYVAETYWYTTTLYSERRTAGAQEGNDWGDKANGYVAVLAILAVALFLFGLASTLHGLTRFLFLLLGVAIASISTIWMGYVALRPVHHIPDEALASFARGSSLENQVNYYYTGPEKDYAAHSNRVLDQALAAFSAAIELDPHYANAYAERGLARLRLRGVTTETAKLGPAVEDLRRAIENGKDDYTAYWNYGAALYRYGQFAGLEAPSRVALEKNPLICGPALNIALASLAQGNLAKAEQDQQGAIDRCRRIQAEALGRGEQPPYSLVLSMAGSVEHLEIFLCAAGREQYCHPNEYPENLALAAHDAAVVQQGERMRKSLKEALTALESPPDPAFAGAVPRWEPLRFADFAKGPDGSTLSHSIRDEFAANPPGGVDILLKYQNMPEGISLVVKVFWNGAEQVWLRSAAGERWKLPLAGQTFRPVSPGFVLSPGRYDAEVYANARLVSSGSFTISELAELKNSIQAEEPLVRVNVGKLTLADNFDNNRAGWWTGWLDEEAVITGTMSISPTGQVFFLSCPQCRAPADFLVQVDTRFVSGSNAGYGVLFRSHPQLSSFFLLWVYGDGSSAVFHLQKNQYTTLVARAVNSSIQPRGANRLAVRCIGATCDLYINERQIAIVEDVDDSFNAVGFITAPDVRVAFDNFRLWEAK